MKTPRPKIYNPPHYTATAIEPIEVIEAWDLGFCLGNVIKYVARQGRKGGASGGVQDLRKARWYLTREIKRQRKELGREGGRTILLGQAPNSTSDPRKPLEGRPLGLLAQAAGISAEEMSAAFEMRNVLQAFPGKGHGGRGDAWPRAEAATAARALVPKLQGRRVILLGTRVAELFGLRGAVERFKWTEHRGIMVATMPHPSLVHSSWWNVPDNKEKAGAFIRAEARRSRREAGK